MRRSRTEVVGTVLGLAAIGALGLGLVAVFGLEAGAGWDPTKERTIEDVRALFTWGLPLLVAAAVLLAVTRCWPAVVGCVVAAVSVVGMVRVDIGDDRAPLWWWAIGVAIGLALLLRMDRFVANVRKGGQRAGSLS